MADVIYLDNAATAFPGAGVARGGVRDFDRD